MWKRIDPTFGNQIRVNRGFYYHHGIYASDDCVIHFAPPGNAKSLDPKAAKIITTTLEEFLCGGVLEVRCYNDDEKMIIRKPSEIVNFALMHLGEGGYDIVNNNCEHFSNLCAFGEKKSSQVDNVLSFILGGKRK